MSKLKSQKFGSKFVWKTLAVILVGVFLSTNTFGWAREEGLFLTGMRNNASSSSPADNSKLAPPSRLDSEEFQYSLTVAAICRHVEHNGNLDGLGDVLKRLDAAKDPNITVLPHEIIIEIPDEGLDEGLAVRYFDPAKANVVTPYSDVSRLSTKVIGPRLHRQVIHRPKALPVTSDRITNLPLIHKGTVEDPLRVVLIMPCSSSQKAKPTRLPVGLMSLASCLRSKEFLLKLAGATPRLDIKNVMGIPEIKVDIVDLQAEDANFDLEERLREINPDVIGVTAVTPLFNNALKIAETAKKAVPNAIRIIGGVHISALVNNPDKLEAAIVDSEFQVAVLHESEDTLSEIMLTLFRGMDIKEIPGTLLKYYAGPNPLIHSAGNLLMATRRLPIDEYPFPAHSLDLLRIDGYEKTRSAHGLYNRVAGVLSTSKGCPFKCRFCASRAVSPSKLSMRSAESVFAEIMYYYSKGMRGFYVVDDNFCINPKRVEQLASLIEKNGLNDLGYAVMTHANSVTPEVAASLAKSHCDIVSLGVETGDERLLTEIGKNTTIARIKEATMVLRKENIHVRYFLMVGLPGQDWASVKKTAELIVEAKPDSINVAVTIPYPGSDYYREGSIMIVGGADWDSFVHEPEPGRKTLDSTNIVTYTDAMDSRGIGQARDLLMSLFHNKNDEAKVREIMESIDKHVADEAERKKSAPPKSGAKAAVPNRSRQARTANIKNITDYTARNEDILKDILCENKPDTLIRVPIEAIESIGVDNVKGFLAALQEAPNGYLELYSMSGVGEPDESIYLKYGLRKKPLPAGFKRTRENTATLFPSIRGEEVDQSAIASKLGNIDISPQDTILSPIGLRNDPAGLIRASILGLKMVDIARQVKERGIDITRDQDFKDKIQLEVLERLKNVCDPEDFEKFNLTPDDIIALATGTINNIVNALKKLIKLLPITPISAEELRKIYEHARKVLIAA